MKRLKIILLSLILASASAALAQDRDVKGIPPEMRAKTLAAWTAGKQGDKFLKENRIEEAIAAYREAVEINESIGGFSSSYKYRLAKALTVAGRTEEALATYKKAVRWDPVRKRLHVNGPQTPLVLMDYATLLARSGKEEEAKVVYYAGLYQYNSVGQSRMEPFPFLVVFDPDPTMTVWEYSPAKLIAAAKMAKAPYTGGDETTALVEEVILMEPDWIVPVMYKASRRTGQWRQNYIDQAMLLAANDDEREWVRTMHADKFPQEIGARIRKASTLLNAAKRDLERNHHRIAVCECEGGHGN